MRVVHRDGWHAAGAPRKGGGFQSGPEKCSQRGYEMPLALMHVTIFIEKPLSAEDSLTISVLPLREGKLFLCLEHWRFLHHRCCTFLADQI